jgi:hypothetical protein
VAVAVAVTGYETVSAFVTVTGYETVTETVTETRDITNS